MADYSYDFAIVFDAARGSATISFSCFDTENFITLYGSADERASHEQLLLQARELCLGYHELWSFSLPASDISRINQPVETCKVDAKTAVLLQGMAAFHEQEPLFDFTIGPVSYVWKRATRVPSDAELKQAAAHTGADKLHLEGCMLAKDDPLLQIDIGGAAKGFIADEVVALFQAAGVVSADIDLGGNVYLMGDHPEGRPWRLDIKVPDGVDAPAPLLEVSNVSAVTSGTYERFVEIDGVRYHHIIDPTTLRPSESDIVSATVVHASSFQADMLATTALLAGSDGLIDVAERHPDARFVVITRNGDVLRANC